MSEVVAIELKGLLPVSFNRAYSATKMDENGRKDELNTTLNDRRTHFIQADIAVGFVFFDNLGCNEMFEIFILDVS